MRNAKENIRTIAAVEIDSQALTTCAVAPDGKTVSLGFTDTSGRHVAVRLPLEQASALAMTLPALIEQALRRQFRDDSLRFTFPLGSWAVEQSPDPGTNIVTCARPTASVSASPCNDNSRTHSAKLSVAIAFGAHRFPRTDRGRQHPQRTRRGAPSEQVPFRWTQFLSQPA